MNYGFSPMFSTATLVDTPPPPAAPTVHPATAAELAAAESLAQPTAEQMADWPDLRRKVEQLATEREQLLATVRRAEQVDSILAEIEHQRHAARQRVEAARAELAAAQAALTGLDAREQAADQLAVSAAQARLALGRDSFEGGKLMAEYDALLRDADAAERAAIAMREDVASAEEEWRDCVRSANAKRVQAESAGASDIARRLREEADAALRNGAAKANAVTSRRDGLHRRAQVCRLRAGALVARLNAAAAARRADAGRAGI